MNDATSDTPVNPFDDESADFLVLCNAQQQYSLWPVFAAVPQGWTPVHGPAPRDVCLQQVERLFTRIHPFRQG